MKKLQMRTLEEKSPRQARSGKQETQKTTPKNGEIDLQDVHKEITVDNKYDVETHGLQ